MAKLNYKVELLTGIRPTGDLTIANYIGAIKPIIEFQNKGVKPFVFVADIHAITDKEPYEIKPYIYEVVADYIALGIDPKLTRIYLQSDIVEELTTFMAFLSRHIKVSELLRIPTLKDKLKKNARPESANTLLFLYPVLMASDILIQRAEKVPVGEDQIPHLELTRLIAKRFNKKYGNLLPIPKPLQIKALRILSLIGEGKMSKTNPQGAIFLSESINTIYKKIKSAQTASEGKMTHKLKNLITIAKELSQDKNKLDELKHIIEQHKQGKPVMKKFKDLLIDIVVSFIKEFQEKKEKIIKDKNFIKSVILQGKEFAKNNAQDTLKKVRKVIL